ncbi:ornithine decarboxylase-like [Halichondria panicea]|uniref:ornithine decarboxylase-like n=1 Tax=Halichondria panicea TaxID=6063 RepID=UPI00312B471B
MELSVASIHVETVSHKITLQEYLQVKISAPGREDCDDPFYVVDLGRVLELHRDWVTVLPTVTPFYAVKCNNDPALLKTLAALGTGFDCASKTEIMSVLDMGVSPDHIIYANPCKQVSHIKYAARKGVNMVTFDNELELYKFHKHFPCAKLVLRIRADDPEALCQLGVKFGCSVPEGKALLNIARSLGLKVVGISFHVGSGSQSPRAYELALKMSAELFEYGYEIGYQFSLLDIGGGFPGNKGSTEVFQRVASTINSSLDSLFSSFPGLTVIAEPGRYFACSTHAIAVNITSKRVSLTDEGWKFMYYVNDGVYGSFNCIMFDHVTPTPAVLKETSGPLQRSSLWGPTCDGLDTLGEALLPELSIGDWLYFDNMGAYTISASSTFNGFLKPKVYYYVTDVYFGEFFDLLCPDASGVPSCPVPVALTTHSSFPIELALKSPSVEVY